MRARIIASPQGIFRSWLLAAGCLLAAAAGAAEKGPAESQQQLERLQARIAELQASLDRDRKDQDALRLQLEDAERRTAQLHGEAAALKKKLSEQQRKLGETRAEQARAEAELARQRSALARQVRTAYVIGRRGPARLLLSQDGSQQLTRVLTYYDFLNRARVDRIGSVQVHGRELAELAQRLQDENASLERTRNRHLGTLTSLKAARAERAAAVKSLAARIRNDEIELAERRADEKRLTALLKGLRSALADVPANLGDKPLSQSKGRLDWPLSGKLLARFGDPKAAGRLKWNGLWIAGREGDPVRSIARGRVAYVGWMHRYGLIVVLEHEGGFYSLYGHNQQVAVGVGDWVQAGDTIAAVGVTGGYDKAGLYFELRRGTKAINPRPWLKS